MTFKETMKLIYILISICFNLMLINSQLYELDLPVEHIRRYFNVDPNAAESCRIDKQCKYKSLLNSKACWGYENECKNPQKQFSTPKCSEDSRGWVLTKEEQIRDFFNQGDFGYIKERRKEMKILCKPKLMDDSMLACTKFTRYCVAKNIFFDFERLLKLPEPMRYREDVIGEGQVGGNCILDEEGLKKEGQHKSPLQSWFSEVEHFKELNSNPIKEGKCDVVFEKPTFIMKLDATVSMYHHFCDFFNLYISLHMNNSFAKDNQIIIWDTLSFSSNFEVMWTVFSQNPVLNLNNYKGKKVCFKDAVLPFLPRMIYGMYYNMPLIPGCEGSGLFQSFSEFVLHRLNIKHKQISGGKIRITLLSRGTKYRRIINENDIVRTLATFPDFIIQQVDFNRKISFVEQLKITVNTDIFIGMHGSGLTHLLFLPDWAVILELYNCGDENCYKDLARLRGVQYMTWENEDKVNSEDEGHHPTLGAHAKFTNYEFDVDECVRLVLKATKKVRTHKKWIRNHENTHNQIHDDL